MKKTFATCVIALALVSAAFVTWQFIDYALSTMRLTGIPVLTLPPDPPNGQAVLEFDSRRMNGERVTVSEVLGTLTPDLQKPEGRNTR